jgi:hypothetical protein
MKNYRPLIDQALNNLGLHGATIANFQKLSNEIEVLTGKKISSITIYRIYSSKNPNYKPYRFSTALLEEFNEKATNISNHILSQKNRYFVSENPRDSSLYKTVSKLLHLNNHEMIIDIFKELPLEAEKIGWERHSIGYALADYIRSSDFQIEKDEIINKIFHLNQFSIYYLQSYIDFNAIDTYYILLEKTLQLNTENLSKKSELNQLDKNSILFCISIRVFIDRISGINKNMKVAFEYLFQENTKHQIASTFANNIILYGRAIGAQIITSFSCKKFVLYKQLVSDLVEIKTPEIQKNDTFEASFCLGIWLDTLILCEDKIGFNSLIKNVNNPICGYAGEPQVLRLMLYRAIYHNQHEQILSLQKSTLLFSDGETKFHNEMIDKALLWIEPNMK